MQSEEFAAGLAELAALAVAAPTAVMCAEAVPWRCHRSLIADALVLRGIEVCHIIGPAPCSPHQLNPAARVADGKITYPAAEQA